MISFECTLVNENIVFLFYKVLWKTEQVVIEWIDPSQRQCSFNASRIKRLYLISSLQYLLSAIVVRAAVLCCNCLSAHIRLVTSHCW